MADEKTPEVKEESKKAKCFRELYKATCAYENVKDELQDTQREWRHYLQTVRPDMMEKIKKLHESKNSKLRDLNRIMKEYEKIVQEEEDE